MQAFSVKYQPTLLAATLLLSSLNANATLTNYTNDGVDLAYSSVSDVTWTKDANLFKTMFDVDHALISKIAAVTPTYNDPVWGLQTIDGGDYSTSGIFTGAASWWGALAFVNYLNSISYAGSTAWRLPTVANASFGFNITTNGTVAGDELPELFYSELGGTANSSIPNTTTFDNEQSYVYWTGTVLATDPINAWFFYTSHGAQDFSYKDYRFYTWAVSPGQVTAVPEADTTAMLLAGLGVLGAVQRRRSKI